MTISVAYQSPLLGAVGRNASTRLKQFMQLVAYGPPATLHTEATQAVVLAAYSAGDNNVTVDSTQAVFLAAYFEGQPAISRQSSWTFILDGHRFYVLPLGPEGDWAYDTTTQEWSQLQTQGFDGMNFTHGVMWGLRVIGGDSLFNFLLELDPTQPLDDGWREVQHMVTGGIPTRGRYSIGVANFSLTASVGEDAATDQPIELSFSDDNGVSWVGPFPLPLTDKSSQLLIWNSLGSFSQPGRVFMIEDIAGPVRFDGADCVLSIGDGADSGQDQEGQPKR